MKDYSKSQKIRISATIIWVIITLLVAGASVGSLVFLNLPTIAFWLGFWIWGEGYISRFVSARFKKKDVSLEGPVKTPVPLPDKYNNYFLKHWFGEQSLGRSYWVNGALLTILLSLIVNGWAHFIDFSKAPQSSAYQIIFIWIFLSVISVWQIVGIWRSATHYSRHSKRKWGTVAQFFTVLGTLVFLGNFFGSGVPQIKEYWLIGTGNDPFNNYTLRVLRDATELEFSGTISFGAVKKIDEYLNAHPAIKLIHLNSIGGRVGEARALATLIENRALSTYTSQRCASACILAYAAGKERLIDKNAKLGFHQYAFPGVGQEDMATEYATDRRYLLSRGVKVSFVDRIFTTPHDDLWEPSHEELFESGFATGYPTYDDVALTSISPSQVDKLEDALMQIPIYVAIAQADPIAYEEILKTFRNAVERGHSMADIREQSLPVVTRILYERLPLSSGEAILSFVDMLVDQLKFYEKENPHKCYAYAMGGGEKNVDTSDMPRALLDRELEVSAEVITSYSKYVTAPKEEDVMPFLETVFEAIAQKYGERANLVLESTHAPEDQPEYCSMIITFYEEIAALPGDQAVSTLRYIFTDTD